MKIFKFVLVLIVAGAVSGSAQFPITSMDNPLHLKHSADSYDCLIKGDTIDLVLYDSYEKSIALYEILDDNICLVKELKRQNLSRIIDFHSEQQVYTNLCRINLSTNEMLPYADRSTEETEVHLFGFMYANDSVAYLLYHDYSDIHFVAAIDNMNRQYGKYYMMEMAGNKRTAPRMIVEGRINCSGFDGFLLGDTLIAVWQEQRRESAEWTDAAPYMNAIVLSKYYEGRWSRPDTIVSNTEPLNSYNSVIGIFRLGEYYYLMWQYYHDEGNYDNGISTGICYKKSKDLQDWSDIYNIDENLNIVSTCVSNDSVLHILTSPPHKSSQKWYYTFDGLDLIYQGIVMDGYGSDFKLIPDERNNIHLFWTTLYDKVYDQYGGVGGQAERAVLKRAALHHEILSDIIIE